MRWLSEGRNCSCVWSFWCSELCSVVQTVTGLMALFHCIRHSTVHYWGVSTGYCTWYLVLFSTTSAEVSSDPYRYQNVTSKLYWSLIGLRILSLLRHWTCDTRPNIDPLDLNQHRQRRIGRNFCFNKRTFLYQPKNVCFVDCWGDVPLVDSRGADPARAWWGDAEWKSLMYIFSVYFLFIFLPL